MYFKVKISACITTILVPVLEVIISSLYIGTIGRDKIWRWPRVKPNNIADIYKINAV